MKQPHTGDPNGGRVKIQFMEKIQAFVQEGLGNHKGLKHDLFRFHISFQNDVVAIRLSLFDRLKFVHLKTHHLIQILFHFQRQFDLANHHLIPR